ncbi:DUF305 domain-containing protein [Rhodocytophaga aerolata]|uniref:DUF305 domain-containing protein n=1 Tax=Rhodocytophaga aerolata TaxID=455078 RepID=A0ABT8RAV7_9BACT|nr:DUF305 domain-containing protein [Rhodocytophaga aerolata]MDO1449236.1 DUF305 domain-containing protein [Rhodocytophaga aerolata]
MTNHRLLSLLTLVFACCFVFTGCQFLGLPEDFNPIKENQKKEAFHKEMDAAMMTMMKAMMETPMTMDPDVDFARMMIPHHIGSVDMAQIELKYGHEAKARQLAQEAKDADEASIKRLQAFLDSYGSPEPVSEETYSKFKMKMDEAMKKMEETMGSVPETIDPDYDFAEMMIHHHQGAIDMSKIELEFGDDEPAKKEAQMIIDHQEEEIIKLGEFRNEHGQPLF